MKGLLNQGRLLFVGNFYTSVDLAKTLLDSQTYVCGTLCTNHNRNPKEVCQKKLKKNKVYRKENQDGIHVIQWKDKRPVLMTTTLPNHLDETISTGSRIETVKIS